jgi:hypothetical protein
LFPEIPTLGASIDQYVFYKKWISAHLPC